MDLSSCFLAQQSATSRQPRLLQFLFFEDQYAQNWIWLDLACPSAALKKNTAKIQKLYTRHPIILLKLN